jgi:hypothetical protein
MSIHESATNRLSASNDVVANLTSYTYDPGLPKEGCSEQARIRTWSALLVLAPGVVLQVVRLMRGRRQSPTMILGSADLRRCISRSLALESRWFILRSFQRKCRRS